MSRNAVVADACLVAERGATGTRCTTMRSHPPLTFRSTPDGVHLIGSAAGPLGGDRLCISVRVEAGATLVLRSAAATIALPGPDGASSELVVELVVAAGATLWWLPEPLVLAAGCDHRIRTSVRLAAGARMVLRDEVVLGRHAEPSGSLWQRLVVDVDGRPLVRNELRVGPRWPGGTGPAVLAGARGVAQTLTVGTPDIEPASLGRDMSASATQVPGGVRGASMALGDGAVLRTELATSPGALAATRPVPPVALGSERVAQSSPRAMASERRSDW